MLIANLLTASEWPDNNVAYYRYLNFQNEINGKILSRVAHRESHAQNKGNITYSNYNSEYEKIAETDFHLIRITSGQTIISVNFYIILLHFMLFYSVQRRHPVL